MSRRCEITGVGPMVGHNVSHSNIKTKRRFMPNLNAVTVQSEALGQNVTLRITNAALRTVDAKGGLDAVLLKARARSGRYRGRAPRASRRGRRPDRAPHPRAKVRCASKRLEHKMS